MKGASEGDDDMRISSFYSLALFTALTAPAARAHDGLHLHPHLVAGPAGQPLHPALVLGLVTLVWAASVALVDRVGRRG
jgi:hypothetical protein